MESSREFFTDFIFELLTLILIIAGVALGIQKNYIYFLIILLGLGVMFSYQTIKRKNKEKKIKEIIKNQWGKTRKQKRDFSVIRKLFDFLNKNLEIPFTIDDITWSDLDMDVVFSKIDQTMSLPGMQYLYYILRRPIYDIDILKKRNNMITKLMENREVSINIQFPLFILGKEKGEEIIEYFEKGINIDKKPLAMYRILSYLPLLGIGVLFYDISKGFFLIIIIIMINLFFYNNNKRKILQEIDFFKYLGNLIRCAECILKIDIDEEELIQGEIRESLKKLKKLKKNLSKLSYDKSYNSELDIVKDYINMVVLREPKIFYKTVKLLNENKKLLLELYLIIGKIDAYIAIASYKSSLEYFAEPILKEDYNRFSITYEEMYHPLLEKPVPYNFELENKGVLITGSNASGKSTFLKTIGMNTIFSQTLYFIFAKKYTSSFFRLFTSIGTTDSIVEGNSYFMAEAKALKRIIDSIGKGYPILCILDEIFRGTNSAERISAAKVVLDYLIEKNTCVFAATHDLELTKLVNERYENYHFTESIYEDDIKFDYILRSGPCTSSNAIAILRYLGYSEEIYKEAKLKAEKYLSMDK